MMYREKRLSSREAQELRYEMMRALSAPFEDDELTDKVRLEYLGPLDLKSPLRKIRAWALYQALRKVGDEVTEEAWQDARKEFRWTSAQVDRALDDLVQHGLAAFSTDEGPITMRLLENEPTPEEIEAMCDEHD